MTIDELIAEGMQILQNDQQHDLTAGFRCRLYADMSSSQRRRLNLLTVQKVLPLWETAFPTDRVPHDMLQIAAQVSDGTVSPSAARREADRRSTYFDDLAYKHEAQVNSIAVGYAAVQAVRDSFSDAPFGCEEVSHGTRDIDVDPDLHDVAFFCAASYADGATWQQESDAEKRREFWMWWLTSAVRSATESP